MKNLFWVAGLMFAAAIFGEVRCIYQFVTSDFEPNYKREVIYGLSAITGVGAIVGYINIPDKPVCNGQD